MPYCSSLFETCCCYGYYGASSNKGDGRSLFQCHIACDSAVHTPLVQWLEQYGGLVSSLLPHTPPYQRVTDNVMHRQMILDPGEQLDIVYCTRTCIQSNVFNSH